MTVDNNKEEQLSTKREINWLMLLLHIELFLSFLVGLHFAVYEAYWRTIFYSILLIVFGILGVTAGNHRLWAHQAYKATTGLKVFLMIGSTLVGHGTIYEWVRWHRLHHKFFGTDLDPFNHNKGFMYAHLTGTVKSLSPAQEQELEQIDMSDIESDKIVMFQKKYYWFLWFVFVFLLPVNAPAEYWGDSLLSAVFLAGWMRYFLLIQVSCLLHSATKIWNLKSGEKYPCDTNWVFLISKTHWLSYHHIAPWDYQTSEFGKYGTDCTSKFIRVCAALEYATDLRTVDSDTARAALVRSVEEKRPISECLSELSNNNKIPKDHFLTPSKYCFSATN